MTRDIEPSERSEPLAREVPRNPSEAHRPEPSCERETVELHGYRYQISPAELATLREIGRFRTVETRDLAQHHYRGNAAQARADLEALRAQGLIQERRIWTNGKGTHLDIAVLSKLGREILSRDHGHGPDQAIYAGFVKAAEVVHDAAIYRMFQAEAAHIEREGGRVRRIVLDYELKREIYRPLAKAKPNMTRDEYARTQAKVADKNHLKVVRGKILLPDLRIEYETREGTSAQVDLELATHHYRGSQMRGKAEARFKMYAPQESVAGLTAAFDPELVTEIFSL